MARLLVLSSVLVWAVLVSSSPVRQPGKWDHLQSPWELSGEFEGDILLTEEEKRNGLINEKKYWPNNTLLYFIDEMFDEAQVAAIEAAVADFNENTCITMKPMQAGDTNFVHFNDRGTGCMSFIGMQDFPQLLNLAPGCFVHGIIMHELLHALGFHHMQSATDRDDYVIIHWDNIITIDAPNFLKFGNDTITDYGVPYDYGSVMHYGNYAFTNNGEPTITTIDPDAVIGQRVGLSESDLVKLEIQYGCRDP